MKRSDDVICNALLTAAHERCVAMMLSREPDATPGKAKFAAHLTLDNISVNGWTLTHSHLVFAGNASGIKAMESVAADGNGVSTPRALDIPVMLGTSIF
jgi:hypothetical protein